MNYDEFVNYVREGMEDVLGDDCIVSTHKVLKNNDIELEVLTVINKESNVSPTIYLNSYYEEYKKGTDKGQIIKEIYELYNEHSLKINFNVDIFKDYNKISKRIVYKLINTKSNEKLLNEIPSFEYLDLSIVFYCLLDDELLGSATALIHNVHMEMWEIDEAELLKVAKANTPELLPYELKNMNDVIREMLISDLQQTIYEKDDRYDMNCNMPSPDIVADGLLKDINSAGNEIAMYVLTNKQKTNGAICMLYDNVIEDFANELEKDLFILPSSVHEIIIVPATDDIDRKELDNMVKDVNKKELDAIDVLSDHVYYYSRDRREVCL